MIEEKIEGADAEDLLEILDKIEGDALAQPKPTKKSKVIKAEVPEPNFSVPLEGEPAQPLSEPPILPALSALPPVAEPITTTEIVTAEPPANSKLQTEAMFAAADPIGAKKLIESFIQKAQIIIDNHASDRDQVNDAITYFAGEVKNAQEHGKKLSPAFIEGWVKLLATKADINANANAVLDAIAKLMAAAKNNNIVLNLSPGSGQGGNLDLEAILARPPAEDEDV